MAAVPGSLRAPAWRRLGGEQVAEPEPALWPRRVGGALARVCTLRMAVPCPEWGECVQARRRGPGGTQSRVHYPNYRPRLHACVRDLTGGEEARENRERRTACRPTRLRPCRRSVWGSARPPGTPDL